MTDLKSMTEGEITAYLKELGQPGFRGKQVFSWLHRGVTSFDEMTNLPAALRQTLREQCILTVPRRERKQVSRLDGTTKYLWELSDGNCIETVLMQYHHGNTVCISSQVGCRMGCAFCASTIAGKVRDLTAAEMLDQVLFTQLDSGLEISNIVLMGIGEPLDNMDTVLKFLTLVNQPNGLNIGMRHISLSTCGLADQIDKLAQHRLQLTLSVSLHAPNDQVRRQLMPIANRYPLKEVLDACMYYWEKTGRRLTFEYSLVHGVNDNLREAAALSKLIRHEHGHVTLNPVNPIKERDFVQSNRPAIEAFKNLLEKNGINVTIRRERGSDIDGACGQLRRRYAAAKKEN